MNIDVNQNRQMMIRMFGLRRADAAFTFFYDETNNIRKFYLTADGTNVSEHKNFVLGGIVLRERQRLPNITELRTKLRMQDNAPEIKFAHVAKGDFEQVLASKKLGIVLSWLIEHDILIHYSSVNIISWSIADIIDAILSEDGFSAYFPYQRALKNELYRIVNLDKSGFLSLMKHYGYPGIEPNQIEAFITDIGNFLDLHISEDDPNLPLLMLRDLIKEASGLSEISLLVGNEKNMLIEGFDAFYTRPVTLFKNAVHIFDRELEVEKKLNRIKFMDGSRPVDFSFADSKQQPGIQLADVVTGLIGKYQCFVEEHPLAELQHRKSIWNDEQLANFGKLRELIDRSDKMSNAFIFRSTTDDAEWRNNTFMHDIPAAHSKL